MTGRPAPRLVRAAALSFGAAALVGTAAACAPPHRTHPLRVDCARVMVVQEYRGTWPRRVMHPGGSTAPGDITAPPEPDTWECPGLESAVVWRETVEVPHVCLPAATPPDLAPNHCPATTYPPYPGPALPFLSGPSLANVCDPIPLGPPARYSLGGTPVVVPDGCREGDPGPFSESP